MFHINDIELLLWRFHINDIELLLWKAQQFGKVKEWIGKVKTDNSIAKKQLSEKRGVLVNISNELSENFS